MTSNKVSDGGKPRFEVPLRNAVTGGKSISAGTQAPGSRIMGKEKFKVHHTPQSQPPPPFNPHVYPSAPPLSELRAIASVSGGSFFGGMPIYPQMSSHSSSPDDASRLLSPPPYAPPIGAEQFELLDKGDGNEGYRKPANFRFKNSKPPGKNPITSTRRSCTDVFCCLLIILFILGWGFVSVLAFMWGKPERLIHPTDSKGRICGFDRPGAYNMSSKPYLLFFDISKCLSYSSVFAGCQTPQICVEECPQETFINLRIRNGPFTGSIESYLGKNIICDDPELYKKINGWAPLYDLVLNRRCTAYTMASTPVFGRCMPNIIVNAGKAISDAQQANSSLDRLISMYGNDQSSPVTTIPSEKSILEHAKDGDIPAFDSAGAATILQKVAHDLTSAWWQIITLMVAAGVISFIWILIMRLLGGFMIWASMLSIVGILTGGSGFCWFKYSKLTDLGAVNDYSFQPDFSLYLEMPMTWMVFATIATVILAIVLVVLCFIRSRIQLTTKLIAETSKALNSMTSTLFFPLVPFVMQLLVFALWATVAIWLTTSGDEVCRERIGELPIEDSPRCDCSTLGTPQAGRCKYVSLEKDSNRIMGLQAYNLFGFFWLSCFVSGLAQTTLAGSFASYYWAFKKPKDVPSFPVLRSMGRAIRYNMGSLAFGSLILAIVKFIRAILDFLQKRLVGAENAVLKFFYRALQCFFYLLEHVLKFLTKRAYIMMAIYGKGFCRSARDSFSLVARNLVRVVVVDRVTGFLLFLGKATITLGIGAVAFFYFSGRWNTDPIPSVDLYYYFVPVIVVLIGSYYICDTFFDVYEMGVDTIFLCFLEDSESNDGSQQKPFYMSNSLKKILGKENEFTESN